LTQKRIGKIVRSSVFLSDSWLDFTPSEEQAAIDVKFSKFEEYEHPSTLFQIDYYRSEEELTYER
jgi:hypothetical protein